MRSPRYPENNNLPLAVPLDPGGICQPLPCRSDLAACCDSKRIGFRMSCVTRFDRLARLARRAPARGFPDLRLNITSRLLFQGLGTDWWLTFVRSDSHRLYSQHRTGALLFTRGPALPENPLLGWGDPPVPPLGEGSPSPAHGGIPPVADALPVRVRTRTQSARLAALDFTSRLPLLPLSSSPTGRGRGRSHGASARRHP